MQKEKKLVPELRFLEFEEEWRNYKLKNILSEHKTRNKENQYKEVFSVAKESGIINQIEHLGRSYASNDISNYKVVFPNDIVYTKSPTVNFPFGIIKQNMTARAGVVSVLYAVFKPKNVNLGRLLDFYFSSPVNTYNYLVPLVHKGAKNTMNISNTSFVNGSYIYLPQKEDEQQKIADFLSAIDNRIQNLEKKKELLEQYKKGITQKIFKQEIRFKKDDGKEYPEWVIKSIGQIFKERNEKNYPEMELLSISLNKGVYPQSESNKIDNSNSDKSKYKRVLENDIAYNSMRMWQGASAVSNYNGIVSPAYTILASNKENSSIFFGYLFKMSFMIQKFQSHSQGLTSDTWNLKYPMISKIKISVPSLEEQKKIANFLSAIDQRITLVTQQITQTKTYKKGLLQQMFV